jgi:hypothetical protein
MEVYTNVMKLFMENDINMVDIDIPVDIKLKILTNILTFSYGKFIIINSI